MTAFDQNFNRFLAAENTVLAVCGQKLSVAFSKFQTLNPFSFSYTKNGVIHADADAPTQRR
jgi:hypothetical protein